MQALISGELKTAARSGTSAHFKRCAHGGFVIETGEGCQPCLAAHWERVLAAQGLAMTSGAVFCVGHCPACGSDIHFALTREKWECADCGKKYASPFIESDEAPMGGEGGDVENPSEP